MAFIQDDERNPMSTRRSFRLSAQVGLALFAVTALASPLRADMLDLTTAGASGFINGAFFQQTGPQPTGTGAIQSFVRIQRNVSEQGYNTDYRPVQFDEKSDPNFTRSLL